MEFIKVDVKDLVGHVTLSREPANAFSAQMYHEVAEAMYELGERDDVAVIIFRAEGKLFTGGNDVSTFGSFSSRTLAEDAMYDGIFAIASIWNNKKPVIAAVQGAAMGSGFGMILACDFIIGGEGVKMGMPEINLGIPAAGCFLAAALPMHVAKRMAFLGQPATSEELEKWGVVYKTVPKDQVWEAADSLATRLTTKYPYRALGVFKQNFNRNVNANLVEKFMVEQHSFMDNMIFTEDFKEAVAAFKEKREAHYTGK